MVDLNPTISLVTLNVNGLHIPIKRQIVRLDKKINPTICCLPETHFKCNNIDRLKVNRWKKPYHESTN